MKPEGPNEIDVFVGARIRAVRRAKGVSQDGLAHALGLTFQQVQKYEKATNRISASMLVRTARYLEIGTAELLPVEKAEATPKGLTPVNVVELLGARGAEDVLRGYVNLTPRKRKVVLSLIRALAINDEPSDLEDEAA